VGEAPPRFPARREGIVFCQARFESRHVLVGVPFETKRAEERPRALPGAAAGQGENGAMPERQVLGMVLEGAHGEIVGAEGIAALFRGDHPSEKIGRRPSRVVLHGGIGTFGKGIRQAG
jgi:hypothetical protein